MRLGLRKAFRHCVTSTASGKAFASSSFKNANAARSTLFQNWGHLRHLHLDRSSSFSASSSLGVRTISSLASKRALSSSAAAEEEVVYTEEEDETRKDLMKKELTFVRNGECLAFPYASKEDFLLLGKRGAYTTARSVGSNAVFEFEAHVERLVKTTRLMAKEDDSVLASEVSVQYLRPKLLESHGVGMKRFTEEFGDKEMKITTLLTWETNDFEVSTLVVPLGERPVQPVAVQIGGKPRKNALAKDSEWTRQRLELEQLAKAKDCNEVILVDDSGCLFEGLQTNFYVMKDGKLQTAGEGILEGTVRKLLLEECEKENIGVDLQPPRMDEMESWQGAFISSTSRLLLPVSEIFYTDASGEEKCKKFSPLDSQVLLLEQLILDRYRDESTVINDV